jgi:RecB family endonuclease NucS
VDYAGRLSAHLPLATRLLIVKADSSVLVHSDGGSYKPLNWMSPPCRLAETPERWVVTGKSGAQVHVLGTNWRLVRREYPTPIGPVDLMCRDLPAQEGTTVVADRGRHLAVEVKRRAGIDAVEQLTRYLELLNRDPLLAPVRGVLAAQSMAPQARTLAEDRGIRCVILDYDAMRGMPKDEMTLF